MNCPFKIIFIWNQAQRQELISSSTQFSSKFTQLYKIKPNKRNHKTYVNNARCGLFQIDANGKIEDIIHAVIWNGVSISCRSDDVLDLCNSQNVPIADFTELFHRPSPWPFRIRVPFVAQNDWPPAKCIGNISQWFQSAVFNQRFVHACSVQTFRQIEWFRIAGIDIVAHQWTELLLQFIANYRKRIDRHLFIGNRCFLHKITACKAIKIIARLDRGVHQFKCTCSGTNAARC